MITFTGAGCHGVESLKLYGMLEDVEPSQKNSEVFNAGRRLSVYSSCELMLMASYL